MSETKETPKVPTLTFSDLGLSASVLKSVERAGYETPSPIQEKIIPIMLEKRDVVGQAQTGTGKTAAFALPLLSQLDSKIKTPQVLVLTPTRELAIQVAEAFAGYAAGLKGFHILPIYGGQDYDGQFRRLKRGVHVVVGTPGRVMDHMRRKTLDVSALTTLVLDEADEMLRMGFIDDVEWVLAETPNTRQVALFSATMPAQIRRIARKYLSDPVEVIIKAKTATVAAIHQQFWPVSSSHKVDALTRILEIENFEAALIFTRTKNATVELSERLSARGYAVSALNGDMQQRQRERTIEQLKKGKLNIVVATDVAARGLDVERISHVINYDMPYDAETYIHRIGRTGRAGRTGDAILFVAPRERHLLRVIEKTTRQKIEPYRMPTTQVINDKRIDAFKGQIEEARKEGGLNLFRTIVEQYAEEHDVPLLELAAVMAKMAQGDTPLLMEDRPQKEHFDARQGTRSGSGSGRSKRPAVESKVEDGMERYRLGVGNLHGVAPKHIVGAIANEAGLDSANIGKIKVFDSFSVIDLPEGMPKEIFSILKKTRVLNRPLNISKDTGPPAGRHSKEGNKPNFKNRGPKGSGKPHAGNKRRFSIKKK